MKKLVSLMLSCVEDIFFPEVMINDLTAVGGILLFGLEVNIPELKLIKIMYMLPALLFAILFSWMVKNAII